MLLIYNEKRKTYKKKIYNAPNKFEYVKNFLEEYALERKI